MALLLDEVDLAKETLKSICSGKVYLVGAGEMGQYLGQYLERNQWEWDAYIDGAKQGWLNGHIILPYEKNRIDIDACFVIASPQHAQRMITQLQDMGVNENRIILFESNRIIYELYAEENIVMKRLLDGAYRECSFGDKNPDKIYMILERHMIYEGILSNVRRFLMGIDYADRNGYIPVIDQVYYPAFEYQNYESVGIDNPWEYFYKQPGDVELQEVVQGCKTVRYYNMDDSVNVKYLSESISLSGGVIRRLDHWHMLAEKYIHLTDEMNQLVESEYKKLFPKGAKVLGVKVREGMMYNIEKKCNRGPIAYQPNLETMIADIKTYISHWNCEYVYLMCETEDVRERFVREFGDRLLCAERERVRYANLMSSTQIRYNLLHNAEFDKRKSAIDYLIEVYLLTKCSSLISGACGASEMACVIRGGYEHMILYDKGYTPNFTAS